MLRLHYPPRNFKYLIEKISEKYHSTEHNENISEKSGENTEVDNFDNEDNNDFECDLDHGDDTNEVLDSEDDESEQVHGGGYCICQAYEGI